MVSDQHRDSKGEHGMKIGIVEDEAIWRDTIQAAIEKYCREKKIASQVSAYGNGKDFMRDADADQIGRAHV